MDSGKERQYVNRNYAESVAVAGGVPVILPLLEDTGKLRDLACSLDGILLTGSGTDVDPRHYGAERDAACGPNQALRDQTDFFLLEIARIRKAPVLAICFGIQSLNVFHGGTLIQDIPTRASTAINHRDSRRRFIHSVEIEPGSILHDLAGSLQAKVNSTHHQAVDRVGQGLRAIARAPDGVIEAVAGTADDHWILGIQWHPEKSYEYDQFSRNILEEFIRRCRAGTVTQRSGASHAGADRRGSGS
jgi:putative glutamine amidotransferase